MIPLVGPGRGAGFFDVDETLVASKTMFSFLRFYLEHRRERPGTYDTALRRLRAAQASGATRAEVNRQYYRLFEGESVRELSIAGRDWFASDPSAQLWLPAAEHLRAFRRAGALTALVSGSFFAALDPIAEHLGADEIRGAPVQIRRGVLTGEIATPMIGAEKARAVRDLCTTHRICRDASVAYGDHSSDVPMLEAVGHPVVVGDHPQMNDLASERGWARLHQQATASTPELAHA